MLGPSFKKALHILGIHLVMKINISLVISSFTSSLRLGVSSKEFKSQFAFVV
jgi:hypothetical protein